MARCWTSFAGYCSGCSRCCRRVVLPRDSRCPTQRAAGWQRWSFRSRGPQEGCLHTTTLVPCAGGCQRGQSCRTALMPQSPVEGEGAQRHRTRWGGRAETVEKRRRMAFPCPRWLWSFSRQKTCFYSHHRWPLPSAEAPRQTLWWVLMQRWAAWLAELIAEPHEWNPAAPVLPLVWGKPSVLWICPITLLSLSCQKWAPCPASTHMLNFKTSPSTNDFRPAPEKNPEKIKPAITVIY